MLRFLKKKKNQPNTPACTLLPEPTLSSTQSKLPDNFWEEFAECPCNISNTVLFHNNPLCPKYQNIKFNPTNTTSINNTESPAPARIKSPTV